MALTLEAPQAAGATESDDDEGRAASSPGAVLPLCELVELPVGGEAGGST